MIEIEANQAVGHKTYAFIQNLSTGRSAYQSLESTFLKDSVARETEQRRFRKSSEPDMLISLSIDSQEKLRNRPVP